MGSGGRPERRGDPTSREGFGEWAEGLWRIAPFLDAGTLRFLRQILQPAAVVAGLGLAGKLTGFLAQIVVAARFGTGLEKSAFDVAMVMPDFLFLFTGGTLAVVLVPVLTALSLRDPHEAARLATTAAPSHPDRSDPGRPAHRRERALLGPPGLRTRPSP
jgi:hypothetical protein